MSQPSGEPLAPPPPSPTDGSGESAVSRKRRASVDENERAVKQARTGAEDEDPASWQRMQDALALVQQQPGLAAQVAGSCGLEMASALSSAGTAASELASPFNSTSAAAHQFRDVFSEHVLPHVSARDACALRCQSRALREIVNKKATVSYSQIVHALMDNALCRAVPNLVDRYLGSNVCVSPSATEVLGICMCAILETVDADVSADVLMTVVGNLRESSGLEKNDVDVALRLLVGARRSVRWKYLPIDWIEMTDPDGDGEGAAAAPQRRFDRKECEFCHPYQANKEANWKEDSNMYYPTNAIDWDTTEMDNAKVSEVRRAVERILVDGLQGCNARGANIYPRMSARLLHAAQECGFVRRLDRAYRAHSVQAPFDDILSALLVSIQRLRDAGMAYDSELSAATLLIQPVSAQFDGVSASRLTRTTANISRLPAAAPLVPALLQAGISFVSSESRGATLVMETIKARNAEALHYMAPLCVIQGLDAGIQRRAVKHALSGKDAECLRILIRNRFAIPTMCVVDEFLHTDDNPRADFYHREQRVKCISALVSNVPHWIASRALDTTLTGMMSRLSDNLTRTPSIVTFVGDFISALWTSAAGDEHMYDALASKDSFYNVVDAAFASHTREKMMRIVTEHSPDYDNEQLSVLCGSDAMVALMKRINELARIRQRVESVRIAASPNTDQVRLTRLLLVLSRCGWTAVRTVASGMPWVAPLVRASVVDTDNLIRMLFDENVPITHFTEDERGTLPVVVGELLFDILDTACAGGDGEDAMALRQAQRVLRWCSMLLSGSVGGVTDDGVSQLVRFISGAADVIAATGLPIYRAHDKLELPVVGVANDWGAHSYLQEPNLAMLSVAREKLAEFVRHTHETELGTVEQLFDVYAGDAEAMLKSLDTRAAMQAGLEPQGAACEIVAYQLASYGMDEAKTKNAVEIVRHTTVGITLPCLPLDADVTHHHFGNDMKRLRTLIRCQEPTMYYWPPPHR